MNPEENDVEKKIQQKQKGESKRKKSMELDQPSHLSFCHRGHRILAATTTATYTSAHATTVTSGVTATATTATYESAAPAAAIAALWNKSRWF